MAFCFGARCSFCPFVCVCVKRCWDFIQKKTGWLATAAARTWGGEKIDDEDSDDARRSARKPGRSRDMVDLTLSGSDMDQGSEGDDDSDLEDLEDLEASDGDFLTRGLDRNSDATMVKPVKRERESCCCFCFFSFSLYYVLSAFFFLFV